MHNLQVPPYRVPERDFRAWLKPQLAGIWYSFIEPTVGSSTGMPDVLLALPACREYLPVELKIAHVMRKEPGRIRAEHIRPAQINWHAKVADFGCWSCFLLGVPQHDGGFEAYVLTSCGYGMLRNWRLGWSLEDLTCVTVDGKLDLKGWERAMERLRTSRGLADPLSETATRKLERMKKAASL
jgi:hypothetical protein